MKLDDLKARLLRKRYFREAMHNNYGIVDVPCDADDDGAESCLSNPDGPEAATAITDLEALVGELGEALANINRKASPDPERTMSEASNDLYWCACEARATLAKLEKARG